MKWMRRFWREIHALLGEKVKFTLVDIDELSWEISSDDVHTIIQDTYMIYVIYKKEGSYNVFPNSFKNRENLPSIKLADTAKPK
mgnify:CR=1 FL=1